MMKEEKKLMMDENGNRFVVPEQYRPYLQSMYEAHDAIIRQCRIEMAESVEYFDTSK